MAGLPATVSSECALYLDLKESNGSCLDPKTAADVTRALGAKDIAGALAATACDSERCLVEKSAQQLGDQRVNAILHRNFKVDGPTDAGLLSNIEIDAILKQWTGVFRGFYAYNFNMRNYHQYRFVGSKLVAEPDSLATVDIATLYARGYRTFACVINTDKYQGGGKHWMALFADARGLAESGAGKGPSAQREPPQPGRSERVEEAARPAGAESRPKRVSGTVEFFNSSGRPPGPEWVAWMVKAQAALRRASGTDAVETVSCASVEHQDSMSECGLYSLYYIWSRLNGVAPEQFCKEKIPDKLMFEFRQHLFTNPKAVGRDGKFDWNTYRKSVKITWA